MSAKLSSVEQSSVASLPPIAAAICRQSVTAEHVQSAAFSSRPKKL